ncbi:MAG TPA: glycosyltransferase family 39 protein [Acidimicrobiales bacterium]|nr:glycosyltransferase family 39 protein [Acidimicrobiales bacterium]
MQSIGRDHAESGADREHPRIPYFGRWLALITACGFGLRVLIVVLSRGERVNGDGFEWSKQGNLNAAGHWFVSAFSLRPDALRPPGWAVVLTIWAWLGQHDWFHQQLLCCAIGSATVAVIGLAARRLAGDRAGLVAAGIAAVYAGFWIFERALLSETLLLLGIAVMILLAYRFRDSPSSGRAAVLGGMCGLLAMIRSEQILVLPLLVLPLIVAVKGVDWRRRTAWLALATVVMLVVVAPWTIFNLSRFQRPVLLSNGFGGAAATGNCNITYYGPEIGYGDLRCLPIFAPGDQSLQDTEDTHTAVTYAEGHLSRLPLVLFAREGRTFGFWNPFQQTTLDSQFMGTWVGVTRLGMVSYWLLLVPAVAGGVLLRRRRVAIYPLLAFVATAAFAVAPTIGDVRYRAAAEVPLVLLAAVAIDAVLPVRRSAFAGGTADEPGPTGELNQAPVGATNP